MCFSHFLLSSLLSTQATKNQKFTLLWHPKQNDQTINEPPVCVKVWIEPGVYLTDGTFLLPKLTWLPFHERNLDIRVLNLNDDAPVSLDLLDVCKQQLPQFRPIPFACSPLLLPQLVLHKRASLQCAVIPKQCLL